MSRAARRAVINERFTYLRLLAIQRDFEARARQAGKGQWDYEDYLRKLIETEARDRERRALA